MPEIKQLTFSEGTTVTAAADTSLTFAVNNTSASGAPTVTDDSDSNYSVSSLWIDVTNDNAYVCVDATVGAAVWNDLAAGGSSGINYITNSTFESGTDGWVTYADAAGAVPVNGVDGSPTLTFTASASSPLRGTKSGLITKDAADRQGEGISYDFTIESADFASVMRIEFDYDFSDSDYEDDGMIVYVYDKDESALIEPVGMNIKAGKGTHVAYFQTHITSTDYRLIIHQATTNAAAVTARIDRVEVGPATRTYSTPTTDWKSFTPTGSWTTNTTYTGMYRRVGDTMEIQYAAATSGAPDAVGLTFNMVSGYTIDTDKLTSSTAFAVTAGHGGVLDAGSTVYECHAVINGTAFVMYSGKDTGRDDLVNQTNPMTFASGDAVQVIVKVPILGWGSQVQMSDEADTREVYAEGRGNGGTSITANTTNIDFTEISESHGVFDGTTFTAPSTGAYTLVGSVAFTATLTASIIVYVNGSAVKHIALSQASSGVKLIAGTVRVNHGDLITLRSDGSGTLTNNTSTHHIYISKDLAPSAIAANELVAFSAHDTTTAATTSTPFIYTNVQHNSHGAYSSSTGVFTAPCSGFYIFHASFYVGSTAVNALLYLNGTNTAQGDTVTSASNGAMVHWQGHLNTGDTVDIRPSANATGSSSFILNKFFGHRAGF